MNLQADIVGQVIQLRNDSNICVATKHPRRLPIPHVVESKSLQCSPQINCQILFYCGAEYAEWAVSEMGDSALGSVCRRSRRPCQRFNAQQRQ